MSNETDDIGRYYERVEARRQKAVADLERALAEHRERGTAGNTGD